MQTRRAHQTQTGSPSDPTWSYLPLGSQPRPPRLIMPPEISAGTCPCAGQTATEISHVTVAATTALAGGRSNSVDRKCRSGSAPQHVGRKCRYRRARMLVLLRPECKCDMNAFHQGSSWRSVDIGRQQIKRHRENQIHCDDKHADKPCRTAGVAYQGRGHGCDQYHCDGTRPEL